MSVDPVLHNAHGLYDGKTVLNVALWGRGRGVDVTAKLRGPGVVQVLCDAHALMSAWLVVHDSPYFAVTDTDGKYRIDEVPAGTYRVTMWHEGFVAKGRDKDGRPIFEPVRLTREVTVPRGGSVALDFALE
jgi:hypothetical protein